MCGKVSGYRLGLPRLVTRTPIWPLFTGYVPRDTQLLWWLRWSTVCTPDGLTYVVFPIVVPCTTRTFTAASATSRALELDGTHIDRVQLCEALPTVKPYIIAWPEVSPL